MFIKILPNNISRDAGVVENNIAHNVLSDYMMRRLRVGVVFDSGLTLTKADFRCHILHAIGLKYFPRKQFNEF
jgi:hypothetical protein